MVRTAGEPECDILPEEQAERFFLVGAPESSPVISALYCLDTKECRFEPETRWYRGPVIVLLCQRDDFLLPF